MTSHVQQSAPIRRPRLGRLLLVAGIAAMTVAGIIGVIHPLGSAAVGAPMVPGIQEGVADDGAGADENGTWGPWDDARAVTTLDPALLAALQAAAVVAEGDGITLRLTSAWRSAQYQQWLFDRAVADYGSIEEAARWVATPDRSAHVQGLAIDIATTDAYSWLDQYGAQFGLCRTFANEGWHFELRDVDENGWCPEMLPDASVDPRRW